MGNQFLIVHIRDISYIKDNFCNTSIIDLESYENAFPTAKREKRCGAQGEFLDDPNLVISVTVFNFSILSIFTTNGAHLLKYPLT